MNADQKKTAGLIAMAAGAVALGYVLWNRKQKAVVESAAKKQAVATAFRTMAATVPADPQRRTLSQP